MFAQGLTNDAVKLWPETFQAYLKQFKEFGDVWAPATASEYQLVFCAAVALARQPPLQEPNILRQFITLEAHDQVFRRKDSPLGPSQPDLSWVRALPGSVGEAMDFAKDILVLGIQQHIQEFGCKQSFHHRKYRPVLRPHQDQACHVHPLTASKTPIPSACGLRLFHGLRNQRCAQG